MSWRDTPRTFELEQESESDSALREEMRSLLGAGPRKPVEAAPPSPELILLAEDLRREAKRRNHTARKQTSWMLMAAAVPFALILSGVSVWGVSQKHKADHYAQAMRLKDAEIQRMAAASQPPPVPAARPAMVNTFQVASHPVLPKPKQQGKELIIPVERSVEPLANDTQRVKTH